MDKHQLHHLLATKSMLAADKKTVSEIESIAKEYPYFAAVQYANFAAKKSHNRTDIALLAIYKGEPYLFATFVKDTKNAVSTPVQEAIKEDILTLINELPNTNPIEITNKNKPNIIAVQEEAAEYHTPDKSKFDFTEEREQDKSLMVMMSFTDWLFHFKTKTERDRQEEKDKKALKTAWQKEKLAAATEEENEEIPEEIFKQAMESISENSIISESLAVILAKQGKKDKAVDMYKKLSLRNPEKNSYFADRIKELTTNKDY